VQEWEREGNDFWHNVLNDGITLAGESIERLRSRWQIGKAS